MSELIGGIIGIIILIYGLNWWKYRHLFEVDITKDIPFTKHWLFEMSSEERTEEFDKMVERNKAIWKERYDTMTNEEIEDQYGLGILYVNKSEEDKRRKEEEEIIKRRKEK